MKQSFFISHLKPNSEECLKIDYSTSELTMRKINITEAYIQEKILRRNEHYARCWESAFETVTETLASYPEAGVVVIEQKLTIKSNWTVYKT